MKHQAVVVTIVAALAADAILHAQFAEPGLPEFARGNASIVGRVVNPATDMPVRAADIVATLEGRIQVTATTDDNGFYRLTGLGAGRWQVAASKGGYVTWSYGQRRPFVAPPPFTLARGQRFTADIPLTRGGAISGRIFNDSGEPIAALQVRAYRSRMERGARRLQAVAAADYTDDSGSFRIYGLPPGDYYVAASLRLAPLDSVVETTYAPTYYPGTGDLAEAQRVRLGLGAETAINFPLLPVRRLRVSGIVSSSSGAPGDAFLNLESEASEFGVPQGFGGVTRPDGTFTISDVAPGRYRLTATLRGDGPEESGWVPVTVDAGDIEAATIVTSRPASLRGTIVAAPGVTRPLPEDADVIAVPLRAAGAAFGHGSGPAFTIGGITEPFRVIVELPETWTVQEIVVNDTNATDTPAVLAPGQEGTVRVVLTDRVTEVTGTIRSPDSAVTRLIVVFPEDTTKWGYRSRHVRIVEADARGRFRITGLPPGVRYLAVAVDYVEEGEQHDPDFLAEMRPQATAFLTAEDEKRTIDVRLVER